MSLGAIYVRLSDNKIYKDPILGDKENTWFIYFDEDEPPELVIRKSLNIMPEDLLKKLNINAQIIGNYQYSSRCFNSINNMNAAISVFLKSNNLYPAEYLIKYDKVYNNLSEMRFE